MASRLVQPFDLGASQLLRELDRRQTRRMQNLVRVRVADSTEEVRVGERSLHRMVLARESLRKLIDRRREDIQSTGVMPRQAAAAAQYMQRSPALRSRLRQHQCSVREVERCEADLSGELCTYGLPVQPTGDHQVQHQPMIVLEPDGDALPESPQCNNLPTLHRFNGRLEGSQQERTDDAHLVESLTDHPLLAITCSAASPSSSGAAWVMSCV